MHVNRTFIVEEVFWNVYYELHGRKPYLYSVTPSPEIRLSWS